MFSSNNIQPFITTPTTFNTKLIDSPRVQKSPRQNQRHKRRPTRNRETAHWTTIPGQTDDVHVKSVGSINQKAQYTKPTCPSESKNARKSRKKFKTGKKHDKRGWC